MDATAALDGGEPSGDGDGDGDGDAGHPPGRSDGGSLGPVIFPGPPFDPPAVPVRRLALGTTGADPLCVVLEDRTLYCIEEYTQTQNHADISQRVANNSGFDRVLAYADDDQFFYGFRSDGSVANWWQAFDGATGANLTGTSYLAAFGDRDGLCALTSQGEVACQRTTPTPAYPPGPYVQFFAGFENLDMFAGLRADGVIVTGILSETPAGIAPQTVYHLEGHVFAGFEVKGHLAFCAITQAGELYCVESVGKEPQLLLQPDRNVRDFASSSRYLCVVKSDGKAACGRLDGAFSKPNPAPELTFVDIDTIGEFRTCGVTNQGELWCWGGNQAAYQIALPMKAAVD